VFAVFAVFEVSVVFVVSAISSSVSLAVGSEKFGDAGSSVVLASIEASAPSMGTSRMIVFSVQALMRTQVQTTSQ
ncbi:MAG: hypothetical protein AB8B64_26910, partial [Granulosicoccus sp.]